MQVPWRKIQPYQAITNDCIIDCDLSIAAGWSLWLPEVYTVSPGMYNSMNDNLVRVIKRLPVGTVVHFQNFYYETNYKSPVEGNSRIQKTNLQYFQDRPVIRHYANLYVSFRNKSMSNTNGLSNPLVRMVDHIAGRSTKDIDKLFTDFGPQIKSLEQTFSTIKGIEIKRMGTDQLKGAVYDYLNQTYDKPVAPEIANKKHIQPLDLSDPELKTGYLKVGSKYVAVLTLNKEGTGLNVHQHINTSSSKITKIQLSDNIDLNCSLVYPLGFGLPFNHVLNVAIEVTDNEAAQRKLGNEELLSVGPLASFGSPAAKRKQKDIKTFNSDLDENHLQSCITMVNMVIADSDYTRLTEKITFASSAFNQMNDSDVIVENAELGNMFIASSPGYMKCRYVGFPQAVNQAVCYVPKETNYRSDPRGIMFVSRMGEPVTVDLWTSKFITNKNAVIFAPSGKGKSFLSNHIVDQLIASGYHVIIIDRGGSYKKLCQLWGDKAFYFDAGVKKNLSFALFLCEQDESGNFLYNKSDEDGEGAEDTVNFVYSIIVKAWKGSEKIKNEEKSVLKKLIVSFYEYINKERPGFPTFKRFWDYIDVFRKSIEGKKEFFDSQGKPYMEFNSLRLVLEPLSESDLLNSQHNVQIKDYQLVCFDLEALKDDPDTLGLVNLITMNLGTEKIDRTHGVRKLLLNDEFIDGAKGDAGDYIGAMYRKGRKRDAGIWLATQDVKYLDQLDKLVRDSIISNCDIKILLDHKDNKESYKFIIEYLGFSEYDMELLESLESGLPMGMRYVEFMMKLGQFSRVYRNEVSHFAEGAYTTTKSEIEKIKSLYDKIGNLGYAINLYAEEKYHLQEKIGGPIEVLK